MQYTAVGDNVSIVDDQIVGHQVGPSTLSTNQKIRRLRRRNFILIAIQLVIHALYIAILVIVMFESMYRKPFRPLLSVIASSCVFVWALVAVYRYSRTGINVFFWLMVVDYITEAIEVSWIVITLITKEYRWIESELVIIGAIVLALSACKIAFNIYMLISARQLFHEIRSFKHDVNPQV